MLSFENLSLVGSVKHPQSATVQESCTKLVCRGKNRSLFENITSLLIANLSIGNCGQEVKDLPQNAFAVDIVSVTNLSIFGVVVRNSTGCGL